MLKNIPVKVKISRDQVDWFNSLKEELIQIQENLSFYNNILREFTAKDIVSLGLDSRSDTIQESSAVITTVNATTIADITADTVILNEVGIANNNYAWCSNWHE